MSKKKNKFYVADKHKEEYTDKLLGTSTYCNSVKDRKEVYGIDSESLVVYVDSKGKVHNIDISSLEAVEEQVSKIKERNN